MIRIILIWCFISLVFVSRSQTIITVAGNGGSGATGNYGPAISAEIGDPVSCAFDKNGNFWLGGDRKGIYIYLLLEFIAGGEF